MFVSNEIGVFTLTHEILLNKSNIYTVEISEKYKIDSNTAVRGHIDCWY